MRSSTIQFDEFELNLATGELQRFGRPVRIKAQAARVLCHLVAHAGRLVPRSDLVELLWPDTIVDYDQGLNNVVRQVRCVLGDDPRSPKYVETVPRQGYRFLGSIPLTRDGQDVPVDRLQMLPDDLGSPRSRFRDSLAVVIAGTAIVISTTALWLTTRQAPDVPPTVAVLSFEGSNEDSRILGASLADGLARDLTVTGGGALRVVGRVSVEKAVEGAQDVLGAGGRLGATHLVTGALRRTSRGLEVELSLRRVTDGEELWHDRRVETWPGLLFSQKRTATVLASLITGEGESNPREHEHLVALDQDVLESYLKARYLVSKGSQEASRSAVELLRGVTKAAPSFGGARVALGNALLETDPQGIDEVRSLADESLRVDPRDPQAHLLRARIALTYEWDWERTERHLMRASELAPGDSMVNLGRAFYFATLRRTDEALEAAAIAQRLDPLSSRMQGDVAMVYYLSGDSEGLLRESEELLRLEPTSRHGTALRLDALSRLGRWEDFRALALNVCGDDAGLRQTEGLELLRRYQEIQHERLRSAEPGPARAIQLASLAARLGRQQEAMAKLSDAIRLRPPFLPFVPVDPDFQSLLSEPRFQEEFQKVGHPLLAGGVASDAAALSR